MVEQQLSLDTRAMPRRDLYYFALRPDAAAARAMIEIAGWCRARYGLSGRPYGADRLHVSLAPVPVRCGSGEEEIAAASDAAARVAADSFSVAFDRICTFGGARARPIVLCGDEGMAELAALRNALRRALLKAGLRQGPIHFQPHVSLLWDRRRIPDAPLEEPVRWTVRDFVLVRSMIGRGRNVDLRRWRLMREGADDG